MIMGGTGVPCANCLSADTSGGTVPGKSRLKNNVNITLRSALFQLYGITFPFPESADDENLILCRNCNDLLFQLHHMFNHFRDLARDTSWIGAAHQDLINSKYIETEDQDEPMISSSACMVQDAACQYEDQGSDDYTSFGQAQFDGRPLRYLAPQHNVSYDSSATPTTPVQLKTEFVYSNTECWTHVHGLHNGIGVLFENWVLPQVIFPTDDSILNTEPMNLTATGPSTIETLMPSNTNIQSSDWETRWSDNQTLKIESTYSLAADVNSAETGKRTESLLKRRPGCAPKTKPPKISSTGPDKSDNRVICQPTNSNVQPKPKVGPGNPSPGRSLFLKPKSTDYNDHKNSPKLASSPQPKYDQKLTKATEREKPGSSLSQLLHMPPSNGLVPQFQCPSCNRGFLSKVTMMTHYEFAHNAKEAVRLNRYHCSKPGCPKIFLYDAASLKAHEKTHADRPSPALPIMAPTPPPKPQAFVPIAPKPQAFVPLARKPPTVTPVPVVDIAQQCHICDKDFHTAANLKTHLHEFHKINVETYMDTSILEPTIETKP